MKARLEFQAPPITRTTLALFAGASGDHNPLHIDIDYVRSIGRDDVVAHGMLSLALASKLFTANFPAGSIRSLDARFLAVVHVHDALFCSAELSEEFVASGERRARYSLSAVDQNGQVKLTGSAVVSVAASEG